MQSKLGTPFPVSVIQRCYEQFFYSPRGDPCLYKHGNHSCLGSYLFQWAFYRNQVRHKIECPSSCSPICQPVSEITAYINAFRSGSDSTLPSDYLSNELRTKLLPYSFLTYVFIYASSSSSSSVKTACSLQSPVSIGFCSQAN